MSTPTPRTDPGRQGSLEAVPLRRGTGRIAAACSVFFGVLSFLGALCFHFPEYLTTPELRAGYSLPVLRALLLTAMVLSAGFGAWTFWRRGGTQRYGFIGIALTLATVWLGGANIVVDDIDHAHISFGLDWFVLALLANTVVFVFIERMWPLHPEQLTLRKEWKLDLVYYLFNHLMISVILLWTTFFSEQLFGWAVNGLVQDAVRAQPVWLQFLEIVLLTDLMQYWGHRLMHENKVLWNIHAVHHCPARMDWLSGSRIHFGEILFTRSIVLLPIFLLGFSVAAVNSYVVLVGITALLIHSNVRIPFGPLKYVIVTPHFHHWHHSADAEAIDKNYAGSLPLLDMVFGTYIANHDRWPEKYGVVGKPLPHGFLAQHLYPFIKPLRDRVGGERDPAVHEPISREDNPIA